MDDMEIVFSRTILSNNREYVIQVLAQPYLDVDANLYLVTLSCEGERLETYEHDTLNEAKIDYNTICQVIKHVLKCEEM